MDDRFDGPDEYLQRTTSPGGAHVWLVQPSEWAASQWVLAGELWRKDPPSLLFRGPDAWSFESRTWTSASILTLEGRVYPGVMPGITLVLNVEEFTGTIEIDASDVRARSSAVPAAPVGPQPFAALLAWLEAYPRE